MAAKASEKAGIQAIANKYPDYNPTAENGFVRRDYEYVCLGTLSLLAGIDLLTGEADRWLEKVTNVPIL